MRITYLKLSDCLQDRLHFVNLVTEVYFLIDFIIKDYQHLFEWYWSKAVPYVFLGKMDFFLALDGDTIIAVLIAQKEEQEKKICTLYVKPDYSRNGIASKLIESSFSYLETTVPIITFTDYKLPQFLPILKKYNWHIHEKIFKKYNKH